MSEVLHGNASGDQLNASKDKTQVYGLAGNDTLISDRKSDALLVGGSGDDSLIMLGGNGTLSGGDGSDIFELNYSATEKISAVIEDLDPMKDKIVVNFDGNFALPISSVTSGSDVVWTDGANLNLTLKSVRENDYFDGTTSDEAWEVLQLTNENREEYSLSQLMLSNGLMAGASIRAQEITTLGEIGLLTDHTRPNGKPYYTVLENKYNYFGENLDSGAESPSKVMNEWMNSENHQKNILNQSFNKLGVGYNYNDEDKSDLRYYWTQLFADGLNSPETLSTANLLAVSIKGDAVSKFISLTADNNTYNNSDYGATIAALDGNDSITNTGLIVSIAGGAGNDDIKNVGDHATINAGADNDQISLSSSAQKNLIQYASGDGNDTITGLNDDDTLSISRNKYNSVTVGNDLVLTVGKDSITLSDAAGLSAIKVYGIWGKRIVLSDSSDDYKNLLDDITLSAFGGDDTIRNGEINSTLGAKVSINSGSGNDVIRNRSNNVTIDSGVGNDDIFNRLNESVKINSGDGDDSIDNYRADSGTINSGAGNDYIDNWGDSLSIFGGTGDDFVYNLVGSFLTIDGGEGDDSINSAFGNNFTLYGGDGNDFISSWGASSIIDGGAGNDFIDNGGIGNTSANSTINGGAGNDTIENSGANVSINSGAGNDSISNRSYKLFGNSVDDSVTIDAGDGNDTINNRGNGITINSGKGDDYIYNDYYDDFLDSYTGHKVTFLYNAGDGNDTIEGFGATSTLSIKGGSYVRSTIANDIVFAVGKDSITLFDAASLGSSLNVVGEGTEGSLYSGEIILTERNDTYKNSIRGATIQALGGDDSISNDADKVSISGGEDNDTVINSGSNVSIDSGSGSDTVINSGEGVTIDGEFGNDSINNSGNYSSINGYDGDDTISNSGASSTVTGGLGNDLISLLSDAQYNVIEYVADDGSDIISGFKSNDTLRIRYSTKYSTQTSGNDIILSVDTDSITLLDAAGLSSVNISIYWMPGSQTGNSIILSENNDEYNNTFDDIDIKALGGNDSIDNDGSSSTIDTGAGDDTVDNEGSNVTISGGNDDDYISNKASNVTIDAGTGNDDIWNKGDLVTINAGDGNDTIDNSSSQVTISGGAGNDEIYNEEGDNVSIDGGAGFDSISNEGANVTISGGNDDDYISNRASNVTIDAGTGNDSIRNTGNNVKIDGGAGKDTIDNSGSQVTISGGAGNDEIYNWEGDNVIIDGSEGNDSISSKGAKVTITGGAGNNFIYNGLESVTVIANKSEVTYIDSVEGGDSVSIVGGEDSDTIYNGGSDVTIDAGNGNDSIQNGISKIEVKDAEEFTVIDSIEGGNKVSIVGGEGADTVDNNGSNVTINGGAGNDLISLSSYAKNNLIIYSPGDGDDTIYGLSANDKLQIGDGTGTYSTTPSGNDVIVHVGTAQITLKEFREKPEHIIIGESGSSGGTGGNGGGSSGGNSGGGSGGGSNSSGGTSSSSNSNSAASGGNSASGSSGTSSGSSGSSSSGRTRLTTTPTTTTTQQVSAAAIQNTAYTGGTQIISNYQSGEKLYFNTEYKGAVFDGAGNFFAGFSTGAIAIQNVTNKVVDLSDAAGNPCLKAYKASNAGVIDGRSLAGYQIINGSAGSDEIYAGVNGSQITGGTGNDTLNGGRGVDVFVTGRAQGSDFIRNASLLDRVNLTDLTSSDITSKSEDNGIISLTFRTGGTLRVESNDILSPTFRLSDGSYFFYNSISKSWRTVGQASENQKVYGGGEQTISSYQSGEKILFNAEYRGGSYDGEGNFKVNSSAGSLVVQNAVDKVIDLTNSAGNSIVKAYAASTSGVINGKDLTGYQIINGSAGADVICAGNGGSQLWGGAEADVLIGGDGADTFITGRSHGADLISNASTADNINLNDATLSDIVGTSESSGTISLSFNTGNVINVQSSEALSARFTLADGSAYRYNHARKTWQSA